MGECLLVKLLRSEALKTRWRQRTQTSVFQQGHIMSVWRRCVWDCPPACTRCLKTVNHIFSPFLCVAVYLLCWPFSPWSLLMCLAVGTLPVPASECPGASAGNLVSGVKSNYSRLASISPQREHLAQIVLFQCVLCLRTHAVIVSLHPQSDRCSSPHGRTFRMTMSPSFRSKTATSTQVMRTGKRKESALPGEEQLLHMWKSPDRAVAISNSNPR